MSWIVFQTFFKDLEAYEQELRQTRETGTYGGQVLPRAQLEDMYNRMLAVSDKAPKHQRLLECDAGRYNLIVS